MFKKFNKPRKLNKNCLNNDNNSDYLSFEVPEIEQTIKKGLGLHRHAEILLFQLRRKLKNGEVKLKKPGGIINNERKFLFNYLQKNIADMMLLNMKNEKINNVLVTYFVKSSLGKFEIN